MERIISRSRPLIASVRWMMMMLFMLLSLFMVQPSFAFKGMPVTNHRYSFDGTGNNEQDPTRGSIGSPRIRTAPNGSAYFDNPQIATPLSETNSGLPSARRVMEDLFRHPVPNPENLELRCEVLLYFGMLISIDLMGMGMNTSEPMEIPCDGNLEDVLFCPATGKTYCSSTDGYGDQQTRGTTVYRAEHMMVPGPDGLLHRATINKGTTYLDMEFLYGTNKETADKLRTFEAGQLDLVDTGTGLLPRNPSLLPDLNIAPGAYSLIVVFMRYHNYVAKYTMEENPEMSDEEVYHSARNYVIATFQRIVLNNYVTAVIGDTLGPYTGYNPNIDPAIDEFFAAVSYRYAHTEQPSLVRLLDPNYESTNADPLFLRDVFRPKTSEGVALMDVITNTAEGIETVVRGMSITPKKPYDTYFVDDLNIWTTTSVLDVQRGREAGIPSYNDVRRLMGLEPAKSMEDLVSDNKFTEDETVQAELVEILRSLYGDDVEAVDAYIGTLFEKPEDSFAIFGPVFTKSFVDQFRRIRFGDRFWYENVYTEEQRGEMLTLTDIIKLVCDGMDKFPWDPFAVWGTDKNEIEEDCDSVQTNQISLLGGDFAMSWVLESPPARDDPNFEFGKGSSIEVTMTASEPMGGAGFVGVGFRSRVMNGADIWFCRVDPTEFARFPRPFPQNCETSQVEPSMFSCCVARGANVVPQCISPNDSSFYPLQVTSWCLSAESTSVSVTAPLCDESLGAKFIENCFDMSSNPDGTIDLIAAYNPSAQNRPHGFQRRTSTVVDLKAGFLTAAELSTADDGLIAYHAVTMMVFWMIMAPIGIYVARYKKTKTWRLVAHISIMGAVGGLMVPILIGVEFAVGATDKSQEHAVVGLALTCIIFPMFVAGRIRYLKLQGVSVGRKTGRFAYLFHKYSGYVILLSSWWNCYTGLVRISPEDSNLQLVVLSSFPLGYDIPIFGFIKDHIFWPYLGFVCFIFCVAEIRKLRLNGVFHAKKLKEVLEGKTLWDDEEDAHILYDEMTMEKFLELTRLGSSLCIIDGRVLDISGFMDHHPGGREMLLTVAGSDITDEVAGLRDIEGFRHAHSYFALQKMKELIIAVLTEDNDTEKSKSIVLPQTLLAKRDIKIGSALENPELGYRVKVKPVFRRGRILDVRFITPFDEISPSNKPVVMLCLAVPKVRGSNLTSGGLILPSSSFKFRVVNPYGSTFEAHYTPVKLRPNGACDALLKEGEEVFEFLISLRPGGQISKASLGWKIGKALALQGPSINPSVLESIAQLDESKIVIMFAAGTGIAPMLQLIDFYADPAHISTCPSLFLIWVVKSAEHNYSDWLNLDEKVQRLNGRFKYVIVYSSSSQQNGTSNDGNGKKRISITDEYDKSGVISVPRKPMSMSLRRSRQFGSKVLSKEESKINRETRISSLHAPLSPEKKGLRIFKVKKGQHGRLIDSVKYHDRSEFAHRVAEPSLAFTSSLGFDKRYWNRHANKSLTMQLNQESVSELVSSIKDHVCECDVSHHDSVDTKASELADSSCDNVDGSTSSNTSGGSVGSKRHETEMDLAKDVTRAFQESNTELDSGTGDVFFFLCGSPRFDNSVRTWLEKDGIEDECIKNFYASPMVHI